MNDGSNEDTGEIPDHGNFKRRNKMSEQNKKVIMVGFYKQELIDLVDHLVTTGYKEEEVKHLQEVLLAKVN